jgi:hypothetical protein
MVLEEGDEGFGRDFANGTVGLCWRKGVRGETII